ncbi:MAG: hypothetical protein V8Q27_05275 [Eubacteriales bacterium]
MRHRIGDEFTIIRHAEIQDLTAIEAVYAHARKFMEETGNPNQWGKNHPPRATLENAIAARKLYVLEEDGRDSRFLLLCYRRGTQLSED